MIVYPLSDILTDGNYVKLAETAVVIPTTLLNHPFCHAAVPGLLNISVNVPRQCLVGRYCKELQARNLVHSVAARHSVP